MTRMISQPGLQLVKNFEGLKLAAYTCPAGIWTLGYGHTKGVKKTDTITAAEAEKLLLKDLALCGEQVEACVKVPLSEAQYSALVSFVFNAGIGSLHSSTLLKRLNAGDYDCVPSELARWVKITDPKTKQKVSVAGLVRRRAAEGELWLSSGTTSALAASPEMPQQVEADDPRPLYRVAAREGLRLRSGAGAAFDVLRVLPLNTEVRIVREKDGWAEIDLEGDGDIDGWVARDFLK